MSGFVGIFYRDGRPVDAAQLQALTESLRFRGPDGLGTWHRGNIGLGHARFTTHAGRDGEPLPLGLDDRFWITGHIRLDAREDLISALCHSERSRASRAVSDAALVLQAYRAWGARCMEHIRGDFSFGIWDEARQQLFCARDPNGVRPLFYAQFGDLLLFGNTLDCLRRHPRVSSRLYEPALADYLMVGNLLEFDKSFFADIRRLPPAQTLTVSARESKVERYASFSVEPELRYRRRQEYVDHFAHVMSQAIADRCPPGPVSLFMSGGLDSATIATTIQTSGIAPPTVPRGFCVSANRLFPDPEPQHARITAGALGLELDVWELLHGTPLHQWTTPEGAGSEPDANLFREAFRTHLGNAAQHARVALDGQGGDELLCGEFLLDELARGSPMRVTVDWLTTWATRRRRPPLGLRAFLGRATRQSDSGWSKVPDWIDKTWARTLNLAERTGDRAGVDSKSVALPRPNARRLLADPRWPAYFEGHDSGRSFVPLEVRWPYFDHRVMRFALRLPPFPWCVDKHLERRAMAATLPDQISRRPKTSLQGDPISTWLEQEPNWHETVAWVEPLLRSRVDFRRWQDAWRLLPGKNGSAANLSWDLVRPVALALWMRAQRMPAPPAVASTKMTAVTGELA